MAKKKRATTNPQVGGQSYTELPNGQLSCIPEIPDVVQKARGGVMDEVWASRALEKISVEIDDTDESMQAALPIQTRVMLNYDGMDVDTQGVVRITPFDREVIDAVASLLPYNDVITTNMIYRVMIGKKTSRYISSHQSELIRDSLLRCSHARLNITMTDMLEKDSPIGKELKKRGTEISYDGPLIAFEGLSIVKNNKRIDAFHILQTPAIIRYAERLGKISTFPIELLDTSIAKSERIIVLQSFLLRSIDEMYRNNSDCFISILNLYKAVEQENASKQEKERTRKQAQIILSDWVEKKYIAGYRIHTVNKLIKGIDIDLSKPAPLSSE